MSANKSDDQSPHLLISAHENIVQQRKRDDAMDDIG